MQQKTVADPSPRVAELEEKRALARCIMGGTFVMRAAGQTYLPKHPAESDGVYKTRLNKTFLDNFVGLAIDKAAGKLFSKEIQVDDLPPDVETLIENIDRQGRALDPFMLDVAKTAFQDGISYVMADMPRVENVQTLADEKALGVRPYAIHIKPSSVLEIVSEIIGGVDTLTRVRIREVLSVPEGWDYVTIEQVRVWYRESTGLVRWELYRQEKDRKTWYLHDEGLTTFKAIYLVPFYANRTGFMEGEPPFQNVAESNLEHWQWKSEHAHALSMCCFGMLTATGVNLEDQIEVGPGKVLKASAPDAKFAYTEPTGAGITLAADALKAIESRIETAGVNLRVENAGKVTATAAALDSEDTNAGLKAVANGFSDSIELLFQYFAEMMGQPKESAGTAHVNDDFGQRRGTDSGMAEVTKGRALGDISREAWIEIMQWRNEIPADFDIEADAERIADEGPPLSSFTNQQSADSNSNAGGNQKAPTSADNQ
jgi:hypothetical protein